MARRSRGGAETGSVRLTVFMQEVAHMREERANCAAGQLFTTKLASSSACMQRFLPRLKGRDKAQGAALKCYL